MIRIVGAIIAGGASTRYGAPKAFAHVGGVPIVERVRGALAGCTDEQVIVANEPELFAPLGLPIVADAVAGAGALAGIHAAAGWAATRGAAGVLTVACDMPFLSAPLLAELVRRARAHPDADVIVPESDGRRGAEPLCAYYSTRCIAGIERAFARDDRRVIAFWDEVEVQRMPIDEVREFGDPATLFMNVNTREERERADALASAANG